MTKEEYLKYVQGQQKSLDPIYAASSAVSGIGDTISDVGDSIALQGAGRSDLADFVTGDSWGNIFNNKNRLSQGLNIIGDNQINYSDIRNNANLINSFNANDLQDTVNTSRNAGQFYGNVIGDAGKGAGIGATIGSFVPGVGTLVGAGVGALAGAVSGIARTGIGDFMNQNNVKKMNAAINRTNTQQLNNFYNTAQMNNQRQLKDNMRNYYADGGDLGNGITTFNTGGTHEQNPYGGIQQGIAADGYPNKVEEGEVKYEDYIYSARLKPSKKLLKDNNLPEKYYGLSYAALAKKLQKESEDRPNDPISKTTLKEWMSRLATAQETHKEQQEERRLARQFDSLPDEDKAALYAQMMQGQEAQEMPQDMMQQEQPMFANGGFIHKGQYGMPLNIKPRKNIIGDVTSWDLTAHGTPNANPYVVTPWDFKAYEPLYINPYGPYRTAPTDDTDNTSDTANNKKINLPTYPEGLRYAPAVGSALGALKSMLQPIDYRYPNELRDIASRVQPMAAPTIGGYERYTPYDVNLGDAENLAAQATAFRANRGQNRATQGAVNIGTINALQKANAVRNLTAQQDNEANREVIDKYNLGIDQANASLIENYDKINDARQQYKLGLLAGAAKAADDARTGWSTSYDNTVTNLYNQLGNVGNDNWAANQRNRLIEMFGPEWWKVFSTSR